MANYRLLRFYNMPSLIITRSVHPCPYICYLEKLFERDFLEGMPRAQVMVPKTVSKNLAGDPRTNSEERIAIRDEIIEKWNDRPQRDIYKEWIKNTSYFQRN